MRYLLALMAPLLLAVATPALAEPDRTIESAPCVTEAQCDLRRDQIDTANRRAEWKANEKAQQDAVAAGQQARARAQDAAESGKLSRIQEVMKRRREAAAQDGK